MKKINCRYAVLITVLIISVFSAFHGTWIYSRAAEKTTTATSGSFGKGTNKKHWSYSNGTLTISGTGAMPGFSSASAQPWKNKAISGIVIEDGITSVGKNAFSKTDVIHFYPSDSVKTIGSGAFKGCKSLAITNELKNINKIGASAFSGCNSISSPELASGVTVEKNAFQGCDMLHEVTVGENASIYQSSFLGTPIASLKIGSNAQINEKAFAGCSKLRSLFIGDNSIVCTNAFKDCPEIWTMVLGQNVSFGSKAFSDCSKLANLTIKMQDAPAYSKSTFPGVQPVNVSLSVPGGAAGYDMGMWSDFKKNYNQSDASTVPSKWVKNIKITNVSASGKKITVKTGTIKKASKYVIQYSNDKRFDHYKTVVSKKSTITFKTERSSTIFVRAYAVKKVNGVMVSGNYGDIASIPETNLRVASVKLSKTSYKHDGKVHVPKVTVKTENGANLSEGEHYSIVYSNAASKKKGKYTVTVTFLGTFAINDVVSLKYCIK